MITALVAIITFLPWVIFLGPLGFGIWAVLLIVTVLSSNSSKEQKRHEELVASLKEKNGTVDEKNN